jgi:hypothetical protein
MLTDLQKRKLTKLFSMYDSDYTGVLVKEDFDLMFDKLSTLRNWSLRSPRCLVLQDKLMRKWKGLEKRPIPPTTIGFLLPSGWLIMMSF